MAQTEQQTLTRVFKDRQITLDEGVSKAFNDNATSHELTSWVQEYLQPDTLLTRDELNFHNNRFKSGALATTGDGLSHRALEDAEFEAAIQSLETSTAAIEKQCQTMEEQKRALQQLKTSNSSSTTAVSRQQERQVESARHKAQLDFEITELADSIQEQILSSTKQVSTTAGSLPAGVDRVLEKDDRLLDGLQKILPRITNTSQDSDALAAEVERLCQVLTTLMAQEVRVRIDSAYNSHAPSTPKTNGHTPKDTEKQRDSLLAELSELSGEIDSLATMAVEGKYRQPILRELKDAGSDTEAKRARWTEYMLATMHFLTNRLATLDNHAQHLHTYQAAIVELNAAHQTVTAKPLDPRHETQAAVKSPATPVAKGLKPLRLVQANISEPQDAVSQLLRSFDIRVKDSTDTARLLQALTQAKQDRHARVQQLSKSTERGISDQLADSITKSDHDLQDLLSAVYAHTSYGTIRLQDEDLRSRVEELEVVTEGLSDEMRGLDVEGLTQEIRKKQKEMLG
ncbi:hypothetical protein LTR78_001758 [Recurvomyces mirabilis]|uniref:Uncharacterized protein n=1 Tax=Recurvomyces mirabilis TaxID=574656 RepID=A0AAE0WUI8_9PEZI|nr:hypothetical protein LTR78_001758 [Recurvomyces mirabilis]KAK5150167.1 hypothetical protein LTS14_010296 [Recurvomyces mirabilis]